ncbi:MAG: 3-dehydroquinate synthase [Tateyamaria sp.]|nr:3-dehydroquinate synthase [Tateyamaria sp.]MBT7448781.1 3-dehydroquinate synthase [Tateyamaria sp.]
MREVVHVPLGERAYDVIIGPGLLADSGTLITPFLQRARVAIVTETHVASLHLDRFRSGLVKAGVECSVLELPPGESTKSWLYLTKVTEWLLYEKIERHDVVVALGGGVVGDLVGFAAAILRRGVRLIQIPTSLLAQVDSSVGGKTGINTCHGKNLVGAFHQPCLVLADSSVLQTLSSRDFLAGYGEVMKYGLLGDADFWSWLEVNASAMVDGDMTLRIAAVKKSVQMKADIITHDETEQGDRALLNLGHTFCHALEAATGYSDRLLHGEGVAIGCGLAFAISARMGLISQEEPSRIHEHLQSMGMKINLTDISGALPSAEDLLVLMGQDKKVVSGRLNFVLAKGIGNTFVTDKVEPNTVIEVLKAYGA